jgi:hypothetical protein
MTSATTVATTPVTVLRLGKETLRRLGNGTFYARGVLALADGFAVALPGTAGWSRRWSSPPTRTGGPPPGAGDRAGGATDCGSGQLRQVGSIILHRPQCTDQLRSSGW